MTQELYTLGLKQAKVVTTGSEFYLDLLHDVIIQFQDKIKNGKLKPENINKNLLFISLRNTWLNSELKNNNQRGKLGGILENAMHLNELEYDDTTDNKMACVSKTYENFEPHEKVFFLHRFVSRKNKKLVMKKLNLKLYEFNDLEESIKNKIKSEYEKS
jgi:hypothetical protein